MAKKSAIVATHGDQKATNAQEAKRKLPEPSDHGVDRSDSSSDSENESESTSDSSDDETENALFRPAHTQQDHGGSDDESEDGSEHTENSEDESSAESENESTTPQPTKPVPASKAKVSKPSATATDSDNKALEDEVLRKTTATVYVEGIPYKADEGDVVSHFASCGTVKEVRMPRYQDSGKPRGYAHVVFDDAGSVPKALKLDGKYMLGRYLTVKVAERPRTLDVALQEQKSVKKAVKGCKTVFIKHLPYEVDEATVKEALASCGTIVSVRLPLWNHTKKLKGFGYVEFSTEDEAVAAAKRSGMKIGDRMVIISLETAGSAPKASFRLADGRFWKKGEEAKSSLAAKLKEKPTKTKASTNDPSQRAKKKHKA